MMNYTKRPIKADLPSKRISAHAQQEKSISPGRVAEVTALLYDAAKQLHAVMHDEVLMPETPLEVQNAIELTVEAIGAALRQLKSVTPEKAPSTPLPGRPTRQQGQFLAFIREYVMHNQSGVAPRHADFQRFFNLTPPSVNSMLIRLELRGFIRRIPGQARAIEIICPPDWIPPLDRPFKF
jgi:hypothetical protein